MTSSPDTGLTELRRGVVEYCVMALLEERERYGLELVRTLASLDRLVTSEGTVYPLLNRLRDAGWVSTTWRHEGDDRPRKYYALTAAGGSALGQFREDWSRFRSVVDRVIKVRAETPA